MKAKKFLTLSILVVLIGLLGGCHYQSHDDYRGYGSGYSSYRDGSGYGSYRDGFREGRAYERRRDDWVGSRYYGGYYRR
jgi:hypothetical protein